MPLKNTSNSYGWLARLFHWLMALLIIGLITVGLTMGDFKAPFKYELYGVHKALGMIVLGLVVLRLLWRFSNPTPKLPKEMDAIQRLAAHTLHIFLYIAMFVMPLSGWAMSSAGGYPVSIFGLFTLPPLVEENKELGRWFSDVHEYVGTALMVAIGVHICAALLHHFFYKDNILRRMLKS